MKRGLGIAVRLERIPLGIVRPSLSNSSDIPVGKPSIRSDIGRVGRDSSFEQCSCLIQVFVGTVVEIVDCPQCTLVSGQIIRVLRLGALQLELTHERHDALRDAARDLILELKDIGQ